MPDPTITIQRFDITVDGERTTKYFALEETAKYVVGFVDLRCDGLRSASFRQLFVLPDLRRRGIGRKLVEACAVRARLSGCETIGASVAHGNVDALDFYAKLGYSVCYVFDDGSTLVAKRLRP